MTKVSCNFYKTEIINCLLDNNIDFNIINHSCNAQEITANIRGNNVSFNIINESLCGLSLNGNIMYGVVGIDIKDGRLAFYRKLYPADNIENEAQE